MRRMALLSLWIAIEIALFVAIGGEIGVFWTLMWVFGTGVAGVFILRWQTKQGMSAFAGAMRNVGSLNGGNMLGGLFRSVAAVCLIMPGFLTDFIGILLLLPPVQSLVSSLALARLAAFQQQAQAGGRPFGGAASAADDVVEGEWVDVSPNPDARRPKSGWSAGVIEDARIDDRDRP